VTDSQHPKFTLLFTINVIIYYN